MFCRRVYSDSVQLEASSLLQNLQKFSFLLSPTPGGIDVNEIVYGRHADDCKTELASLWKPVCWHWHVLTHWSPNGSWLSRLLSALWAHRYLILQCVLALLFLLLILWPFIVWLSKKLKEWWSNRRNRNSSNLSSDSSNSLDDDDSYHMLVNESTELGNKEFTNPVAHREKQKTLPGLSRTNGLEDLTDEAAPEPKKSRV